MNRSPFRYFKTSPEVNQLGVLMYADRDECFVAFDNLTDGVAGAINIPIAAKLDQ